MLSPFSPGTKTWKIGVCFDNGDDDGDDDRQSLLQWVSVLSDVNTVGYVVYSMYIQHVHTYMMYGSYRYAYYHTDSST